MRSTADVDHFRDVTKMIDIFAGDLRVPDGGLEILPSLIAKRG
jgi:hypothetical protein